MEFTKGGVEQELHLGSAEERAAQWAAVREAERLEAEAPKERIDRRPLFEKLAEQRAKKDAEFESKYALKNQVYLGLDADEYEFVKNVQDTQEQRESERWKEEVDAVKEFREAVLKSTTETATTTTTTTSRTGDANGPRPKVDGAAKRPPPATASQSKLLKGLRGIVRKRGAEAKRDETTEEGRKKAKTDTDATPADEKIVSATESAPVVGGAPILLIAGYGSDSDDSDD